MVNINMFEFKHPKYYKELCKRNKLDQVISKEPATAGNQRAPGPGLKHQASSTKLQASSQTKTSLSSETLKQQAASVKS